jgi:hypothetical protein
MNLTTLDRGGDDCGDKVRTSGVGKDPNNSKPIRCQRDNMVSRQDKVMMTDQSHAAHAAHGAPATVPVMLHFARGRSRILGERQSGGNPAQDRGQTCDSTRRCWVRRRAVVFMQGTGRRQKGDTKRYRTSAGCSSAVQDPVNIFPRPGELLVRNSETNGNMEEVLLRGIY